MKLTRKLSTKQFIWSQIIILFLGLLFLGGLFYITDFQYQKPREYSLNGPVTKEPSSLILELNTPDNNLLSFDSSLLISGKTQGNTEVLITSADLDLVTKSKSDGSFSATFTTVEGLNEIKIITFGKKGEQKETDRTIYYSKEKI